MAIPEVETITRLSMMITSVIEYGGDKIPGVSTYGLQVDPEFFEMFPYYRWKEGLPEMFKAKDAVKKCCSITPNLLDKIIFMSSFALINPTSVSTIFVNHYNSPLNIFIRCLQNCLRNKLFQYFYLFYFLLLFY